MLANAPAPSNLRQQRAIAALNEQEERVLHFAQRARTYPASPRLVVVLLNVDCPLFGPLARLLMPDNEAEWQRLRQAGAVPFARGLAQLDGVADYLRSVGAQHTAELLLAEPGLPVLCCTDRIALAAAVPL